MKHLSAAGALTAAAACFVLSALPAFGSDTGTISATVTAATPCITIDTTSVDFGTLGFSTSSFFSAKVLSHASAYRNCGATQEAILARGTDAQSGTSAATWSLTQPSWICNIATANGYGLELGSDLTFRFALSKQNASFETLGGNASGYLNLRIDMPCTGSAGAGEKMNFQYILTAIF